MRPRPSPHEAGFALESVATKGRRLPNRVILHALEGWGKTSFAAHAPNPIFLMVGAETGLWTLMDSGQLPETVPHFPRPAETWTEARLAVNELIVKEHPYRTLVVDTLNGLQQLDFAHVCHKHFKDEWSDFESWQRGAALAVGPWLEFLALLDRLREKGVGILLLCHTAVEKFQNPEGPDYDRYQPALNRKYIWPATHKWADMVLFGSYETFVDKANKSKSDAETKGKAKGGQQRVIYTERHAAYDAKNRHGLPEEIECGVSAAEAWANFAKALRRPAPEK